MGPHLVKLSAFQLFLTTCQLLSGINVVLNMGFTSLDCAFVSSIIFKFFDISSIVVMYMLVCVCSHCCCGSYPSYVNVKNVFKKMFLLILERGRERKRIIDVRDKHGLAVSCTLPTGDWVHKSPVCAWPEMNQVTFWSMGQCSTNWPWWPGLYFLKM